MTRTRTRLIACSMCDRNLAAIDIEEYVQDPGAVGRIVRKVGGCVIEGNVYCGSGCHDAKQVEQALARDGEMVTGTDGDIDYRDETEYRATGYED